MKITASWVAAKGLLNNPKTVWHQSLSNTGNSGTTACSSVSGTLIQFQRLSFPLTIRAAEKAVQLILSSARQGHPGQVFYSFLIKLIN